MFEWDYVVSGDRDAAQAALREVLQQHEFSIDERSRDEWKVEQGSMPSFFSRMLGDPHVPVDLTVRFADAAGGTSIGLHRSMFSAAGGVSRDPRTMEYADKAYRAAAAAVHDALSQKGVLLSAND